MSRINRAEYLLRAKMPAYRRLEARLYELLQRELDRSCYISFSAGKDSTVCAHACQQILPGIPILLADSGVPYRWLESERQMWIRYAAEHGWNLLIFPWDKWGVQRPTNDLESWRASVHSDQFAALDEWARQHGCSRRVMGLRSQESRARRYSLGTDHGLSAKRICPISLWKVEDVWTYLVKFDLPWLSIYDHLGPIARNGLIDRQGMEHGRLEYLRRFYPEAWRVARELFSTEEPAVPVG